MTGAPGATPGDREPRVRLVGGEPAAIAASREPGVASRGEAGRGPAAPDPGVDSVGSPHRGRQTVERTAVADLAADLLAVAARRRRRPLIVIDGGAGAGKTTLATALAAELTRWTGGPVTVVHGDDFWVRPDRPADRAARPTSNPDECPAADLDGPASMPAADPAAARSAADGALPAAGLDVDRLRPLLAALAAGQAVTFHRWDWVADRPGERVDVPPGDGPVVVEGLGCAQPALREFATTVIAVVAPTDVRVERGVARDVAALLAPNGSGATPPAPAAPLAQPDDLVRAQRHRWASEWLPAEQRSLAGDLLDVADWVIDGADPDPAPGTVLVRSRTDRTLAPAPP